MNKQLNQVVRSDQLTSLIDSAPRATVERARQQATQPADERSSPRPALITPVDQVSPAEAAQAVPLQIKVPAHVRKQLEFLSVERSETMRSIVLLALRDIGLKVSDEEIYLQRGPKPRD